LRINAAAAQSLGMALHELSVNAVKYGALSNRTGTVNITWAVEDAPGGKRFAMAWRENGGPAVKEPSHSGLGTLILTRLVEQSLGAEVKLDLAREGLSWTLTAPLASVAESGLFGPP
jgi:two-component sensor histidine kinase